MDRPLCTVREIIEDIGHPGKSESEILSKILAASQAIEQEMGNWLPIAETRYFPVADGHWKQDDVLLTSALLSVSKLTVWGTERVSADFRLWPYGRHWANGPYSGLEIDEQNGTLCAWAMEAGQNEIEGTWGMYDEAVSIPLSAVSQSDSATTITVSDGSQLSAGMVLKLDDEWEVVTGTGAGTDTGEVLNSAADVTLEELELTDGTAVKAGEVLRIDFERMLVIEVQDDLVLVMRGWDGSKRAAHAGGASVYVFRTFNVRRGVNGSMAAAHTDAEVLRQVAPMDVNYLCRQMAALMLNKAKTGYVGRAGNDELGTGFFVNEFPKNQIQKVKDNYPWFGR